MLGAGMTLAAAVGVFAFGGHLVDGWLQTSPLFLILGLLLGATGGFIHLFSVVAPGVLPFGRSRARSAGRAKGSESHRSKDKEGPRDPESPSSLPKT